MTENFADRKAKAAANWEAMQPLIDQSQVMQMARDYADENDLHYPPTLIQGIEDMRALLASAGLPDEEISRLPGLAPVPDSKRKAER